MSPTNTAVWAEARGAVAELAPVLRRAVDLDPECVARLRFGSANAAVYVRLPFDVLVSRTVTVTTDAGAVYAGGPAPAVSDTTVLAGELLRWLDDEQTPPPIARDADWRGGLPPAAGWRRIDSVPDEIVRDLVRQGALALKDAARREGVPDAQPRTEVADALLNSIVLIATADGMTGRAEITLRSLGALTRMGFLARGSHANIDVSGRWTRIAASYGSVFAERVGLGLTPH